MSIQLASLHGQLFRGRFGTAGALKARHLACIEAPCCPAAPTSCPCTPPRHLSAPCQNARPPRGDCPTGASGACWAPFGTPSGPPTTTPTPRGQGQTRGRYHPNHLSIPHSHVDGLETGSVNGRKLPLHVAARIPPWTRVLADLHLDPGIEFPSSSGGGPPGPTALLQRPGAVP